MPTAKWKFIIVTDFFLKIYLLILGQSVSRAGMGAEGERGRAADSALSLEPDVGLDRTTREIMTSAETRSRGLTHSTT